MVTAKGRLGQSVTFDGRNLRKRVLVDDYSILYWAK